VLGPEDERHDEAEAGGRVLRMDGGEADDAGSGDTDPDLTGIVLARDTRTEGE
jgi:hypothetical protein